MRLPSQCEQALIVAVVVVVVVVAGSHILRHPDGAQVPELLCRISERKHDRNVQWRYGETQYVWSDVHSTRMGKNLVT